MPKKSLVIILVGSLIALVGIGVFARTLNLCFSGDPICAPSSPSHPSQIIFPSMCCLSLFGLFVVWIGIRVWIGSHNVNYTKSRTPTTPSSNAIVENTNNQPSTNLQIKRRSSFIEAMRSIHVFIDGEEFCELRNGEEKRFSIGNGQHQVHAGGVHQISAQIKFDIQEGDSINLDCGYKTEGQLPFINVIIRKSLDFHPKISNDITEALSISDISLPQDVQVAISQETQTALKGVFKEIVLGVVMWIVSLIAIAITRYWMFYLAGVLIPIITFLIFIPKSGGILRKTLALRQSSPNSLLREFYTDRLTGDKDRLLIRFYYQLLTSTARGRANCSSPAIFQSKWDECFNQIETTLKSAFPTTNDIQNAKLYFDELRFYVVNTEERVAKVECTAEAKLLTNQNTRVSAFVKFHNIAIKVADKWYLLIGEPQ